MTLWQWVLLVGFIGAVLIVTYCLCTAAKWGDEAQERWTQEEQLRAKGRLDDEDDTKTYPDDWPGARA